MKASALFDYPATVLIPRANRVEAQISVVKCPVVISTNLAAAPFQKVDDAIVIASFLSSCFAQLDMELRGVNQEGARKLEMEQISAIRIPVIQGISSNQLTQLKQAYTQDAFVNFKNLTVRPTDLLWAEIIASGNKDVAKRLLEDCIGYLSEISDIRQA